MTPPPAHHDPSKVVQLWHTFLGKTPALPTWATVLTLLAASAAVLLPPAWRYARNVITIAHEGGHALVAVLVGRRLAGIKLHSDTSGVTVSAGRPDGLGVIATALAGYLAPAGLGLAAAALLFSHHTTALLWGVLVALAVMLLMIRNMYGALTVVLTGGVTFLVVHYAGGVWQSALAWLLTWFLLIAGPKPVWELHRKRRLMPSPDSDADQLARLTGIPGGFWVVVFGLGNLAALAVALKWLVGL